METVSLVMDLTIIVMLSFYVYNEIKKDNK
jgi:hypothetical protein